MPGDRRVSVTDEWVLLASRFYESRIVFPPLDIVPAGADGCNVPAVDLECLCDAIFANLKLPKA